MARVARHLVHVLALVAALTPLTGCYREVASTQQMTWSCEPGADQPTFPNAQSVRLRYQASPSISELEAADHLCDRLTAMGKPVIDVRFLVSGDPWSGMRGYRIEAIAGMPYTAPPGPLPYNASIGTGAWGSSRREGDAEQPFPLDAVIPHHRLF